MTNPIGSILGTVLILEKVINMFGKTQEVKFTLVDGVPTEIATVTEKNVLAGALSHVVSHLTADTVVIGMGRSVAAAAMVYAPMVLVNHKLTGSLRFNPFSNAR